MHPNTIGPHVGSCTVPRFVRFMILPFAMIGEFALLFVAWGTAAFSLDRAEKICAFADTLPDFAWYFGKKSNPTGLRSPRFGGDKQDPVVLPPDFENHSGRK